MTVVKKICMPSERLCLIRKQFLSLLLKYGSSKKVKKITKIFFSVTLVTLLFHFCVLSHASFTRRFFSLFCMKKKGKAVDLRLQSHLYFLSSLGEAFNQKHACHAYISTLFCLTQRNEQTIDKRCQRERYGSNLVLLRILT